MRTASEDEAPAKPAAAHRWWREVLYIAAFYAAYTAVRDTQGSASGSAAHAGAVAAHHARTIIHIERDLFLYHERAIQKLFLHATWLIRTLDVFYGSAHFLVTGLVLIWLYRRCPERYALWRNVLAFTTLLALIGFALYPLMPPRLLPHSYGFVDTLHHYGGSWSFDSSAVQRISNQYAAMPSLHFAWSAWCGVALYPAVRHRWSRALAVAYPLLTLLTILVTANHFLADVVAGAVALGVAFLIARGVTHLPGGVPLGRAARNRQQP